MNDAGSPGAGGEPTTTGGSPGSTGGAGGTSDGAQGGVAGSGAAGGETGCPSDSAEDGPPALDAICDPAAEWGTKTSVPLTNVGTRIVAITPDELSIVYYAETSGPLTFWAADRPSPDASFDAGQDLPGLDIVALSPDGLRLITLLPGRRAFNELTRGSRDGLFEDTGEGAFAALNADADADGLVFSSCVIAPDDLTLYYTASNGEAGPSVVRVAMRSAGEPWRAAAALEACELDGRGPLRRIPTGVSADGLTLFFFDETTRVQRAAWRPSADGSFTWFRDLDGLPSAQPNLDCSRLYFNATAGPAVASVAVAP